MSGESKSLKMVTCGRCGAKTFIPGDLPPFETVPCSKCEHPVMLPVLLHNYELRSVIASGGMGTVFRAFDTKLQRDVALKMMKREMAQDKEVMEAFYREARAGASLNHTNIIHIYAFDEFQGQPYLVMELADQGSVDSIIEHEGRCEELLVLDVAVKVGSALATALKHNLLHRDIKPGNILFNVDREPKLVDFGLARAAETADNYENAIWGTPYYVAPEKINRQPETFLSDMYSLGGTLYHALTGHVPFEAPTVEDLVSAHVYTPLTPPNEVVLNISHFTSDAIVRAMAKEPLERFQSYDEFIMAFEYARSMLLTQQVRESNKQTKSWWRR